MTALEDAQRQLVIANRILAREGVVDAYGHISIRHPEKPDRFLLSRAPTPELVVQADILAHGTDGEAIDGDGAMLYAERFIHAAIYAARPDVVAVVHNHSPELIPFGVTATPLRPVFHVAARMGSEVPVWDIAKNFGDTNLLVVNMDQAVDLTRTLAKNRMVLMRGHGCAIAAENLRTAVMLSIYSQVNARAQMQAMQMGEVKYLSAGEIERAGALVGKGTPGGRNRTWEYFRHRAGCDHM